MKDVVASESINQVVGFVFAECNGICSAGAVSFFRNFVTTTAINIEHVVVINRYKVAFVVIFSEQDSSRFVSGNKFISLCRHRFGIARCFEVSWETDIIIFIDTNDNIIALICIEGEDMTGRIIVVVNGVVVRACKYRNCRGFCTKADNIVACACVNANSAGIDGNLVSSRTKANLIIIVTRFKVESI